MAIPQLDNAPRCQHIHLSGRRCKAPAKRGKNYCLFHEAEHDTSPKLTFPPVEDAASVQVAADQILQALRDDTIEFQRASLMFSGLRILRANLRQLGLELADLVEAAPNKDPDDIPGPSLAEILLERLNAEEAEEARKQGVPAPAPIDIQEAITSGKDLGQILMERLQIVEDDDGVVPPGLEEHGATK
jgi:hypothetical protein